MGEGMRGYGAASKNMNTSLKAEPAKHKHTQDTSLRLKNEMHHATELYEVVIFKFF